MVIVPTTFVDLLIVRKISQIVHRIVIPACYSACLIGAIVFAEMKQRANTCRGIVVTITGQESARFIDKEDLLRCCVTRLGSSIIGTPWHALPTRLIGNIIKSNNFVKDAIVAKSWQGYLAIKILPRRPIARLIYPDQTGQYVDEDGVLLPLSDKYTARVLLAEVAQLRGTQQYLSEHAYGTALLALFNYIDRDEFWRAQIAHMCIDPMGKIVMYTQVSKQRIEFGFPEGMEKKLTKLTLFYQQIIPYKGWDAYQRVNLEFDNQIVCE